MYFLASFDSVFFVVSLGLLKYHIFLIRKGYLSFIFIYTHPTHRVVVVRMNYSMQSVLGPTSWDGIREGAIRGVATSPTSICSLSSCIPPLLLRPARMVESTPPPKNVGGLISEYIDCKKSIVFFKLATC